MFEKTYNANIESLPGEHGDISHKHGEAFLLAERLIR